MVREKGGSAVKRSETLGTCLCGAITVELPEPHSDVGVCHCAMCRTWTSGPWMALQVPGAQIRGDTLAVYSSSSFAERGFCSRCGAHIFHRPKLGDELAISAGLFRSQSFSIEREIFSDAKPPFYRFVAGSRKSTSWGMVIEWAPKIAARLVRRAFGR